MDVIGMTYVGNISIVPDNCIVKRIRRNSLKQRFPSLSHGSDCTT
jgi:hypothetical protein